MQHTRAMQFWSGVTSFTNIQSNHNGMATVLRRLHQHSVQ